MERRIFEDGYNTLTERSGCHSDMLMDIGVQVIPAGGEVTFVYGEEESAYMLLSGAVTISWNGNSREVKRDNVFDESPAVLHVPRNTEVRVTASAASELLVQRTENSTDFEPVFYRQEDIKDVILHEETMDGCARRTLRDVFNYSNAPYSNMVLGEVLHSPGRWSSYPPHHHPQPEVYFYKFSKPQGFGVSIVGDEATVVMDNHIAAIPGGLCHPQVAAPGYTMYYVWMIRHLDGNPWTTRIDDPAHTHLLQS